MSGIRDLTDLNLAEMERDVWIGRSPNALSRQCVILITEIRRLRSVEIELRKEMLLVVARMNSAANVSDKIQETNLKVMAEVDQQRALIEGLTPLARLGVEAIIECAWQGCDFDGADIQRTAVKLSAVVETNFDPKIHEDTWGIGMVTDAPWFEFPPAVLAAKRALENEGS